MKTQFTTALTTLFVSLRALAQAGDGDIITWGVSNCSGSELSPPSAPGRPAGTRYIDVGVGYTSGERFYAIRSDGVLVAWGAGSTPPLPSPPAGVHYTGVSAGTERLVLVRSDGVVVYQNNNSRQPPPEHRFIKAEPGFDHYIALTDLGAVVCWGANESGQCNVPSLPPGRRFTDVEASGTLSVALVDDGSIRSWGSNGGWPLTAPTPPAGVGYVKLGELSEAQNISAIRSDGTVVFWGGCYNISCSSSGPSNGAYWTSVSTGASVIAACRTDGTWLCRDASSAFNLCNISTILPGHFASRVAVWNCVSAAVIVQDCNLNGIPDSSELGQEGADFNGDHVLDECQCIADLFVDGRVDGADLAVVHSQWGLGGAAVADINRDGVVNGTDLSILLSSWGSCP
ncbi:MAG: hypothetical protein FJ254_05265 [Phycisphaerae bacterium]|nr:hypothetical protein [Phycisphaerae bacterium]